MAGWGYEFYLLVLKVSLRYFQDSKIQFVYPRGHLKSSIYNPLEISSLDISRIYLRCLLRRPKSAQSIKRTRSETTRQRKITFHHLFTRETLRTRKTLGALRSLQKNRNEDEIEPLAVRIKQKLANALLNSILNSRHNTTLKSVSNDRAFSFERNCVLCRWESETLK